MSKMKDWISDSPEIDGPITIKNWNPFQDHYPLVEVSARAFDIEELFLGISCTHCQIDQINRWFYLIPSD